MLSPEKTQQIKQQLLGQIDKTMSGNDLEETKRYIDSLTPEELEDFLKRNNMAMDSGKEKCIFCSIVFGDVCSYQIDKDENSIAVLEINPISKGHVLVVPKNHTDTLPKETAALAERVSENMQKKLSPKKVLMSEQTLFGHKIIALIPVYNNENMESKRYSAPKNELEAMQKLLAVMEKVNDKEKIERAEKKPKQKKMTEKNTWLPKRFP